MKGEKPVFVQIIEMIEDDILSGTYGVDDLIISTPQISKLLSVNPTTAQRAIGVLTDRGVIYKKRGVGMAVTKEAREMILNERKKEFYEKVVQEFINGAKKIGISDTELLQILKENLHD
ncbi:GntR family transcriptional regulator [Paenibacillus sp. MMS20-IR301]|uniref:GntR family transcriptional regulator n=1 Tax=Paenibacillus sp. MMS20-IR301 TaxID=2895946 RepID=UPI0028ECAD16|nr:GntR family transcriptional regulator [Paenibacillus sp. MMS20-IR301]WNS45193.1 GntR family transcriptional regulator [Paenibacillus sp. MMS20-IR301]